MTSYNRPMPPDDPASLPHWEGARHGMLMLQRCKHCDQCRFPATRTCPNCHSSDNEWIASSGYGTVESFCVFHKAYWPAFAEAIPYDVIQVRLDEGVQLMSNIIGLAGKPLKIGMRVKACFDAVSPELTLIKFAPLGSE